MSFDAIDRQFKRQQPVKIECLCCGTTEGVEMKSSRTAYHFDGPENSPDNPNRPIPLCRLCAEKHHQHYDLVIVDEIHMTRAYDANRIKALLERYAVRVACRTFVKD